jgi:predicted dehydrogenase
VDYVRRPPRRYIEITGEHGVLRWEFDANRVLHYDAAVSTWRTEEGDPRFARNAMFMDELRSFVNLTRGQDRDVRLCNAEHGAAVLSVALAALQSANEGRTIPTETMTEVERAWLTSFERPNITCE